MFETQIRLATVKDADEIHELHTVSVRVLCKEAYSSEIIDGWLKGRTPDGYQGIVKDEMYVIEHEERIIGFSHIVPGEIVAIFVHPDVAGRGVGSTLVQHGIKKAQTNWNGPIKVESTLNAELFYEKNGFITTGARMIYKNSISMRIIEMELTTET